MLRVKSWNLLSPQVAARMSYLYKHCILENRFPRILDRILQSDADVLCFQEVEAAQFQVLRDTLPGYNGFYLQRPDSPDGCATFLRHSIVVLHTEHLQLKEVGTLSDRGNVCLIHVIKYQEQVLIVSNTHILYNPRRGYIKAAQLVKLFSTIAVLMARYECPGAPLICCGDYNLAPESLLHTFITHGTVSLAGVPEHLLSLQETQSRHSSASSLDVPSTIVHPFLFQSAYTAWEATHATQDLKHNAQFSGLFVDYIFYGHYNPLYAPMAPVDPYSDILRCQVAPLVVTNTSTSTLTCECVKQLPDPSECYAMPNENEPSDHFDIQAEFVVNHAS